MTAEEELEIERRYIKQLMLSRDLAHRSALPVDCNICRGEGATGPDECCEACGGWNHTKRARRAALIRDAKAHLAAHVSTRPAYVDAGSHYDLCRWEADLWRIKREIAVLECDRQAIYKCDREIERASYTGD